MLYSYRNQIIDLFHKLVDQFLYEWNIDIHWVQYINECMTMITTYDNDGNDDNDDNDDIVRQWIYDNDDYCLDVNSVNCRKI